MKCHLIFSEKYKRKIKRSSTTFVISALWVSSRVDNCRPDGLLQYYYFCQKHNCNTIITAGSYCNTFAITIGNIICLKKANFNKALVLMTFSVGIPFESHTVAVNLMNSAFWQKNVHNTG